MTFVLVRNEGGYNFVKNLKKDIFMTPNSGQNRSSETLNSNNFRKLTAIPTSIFRLSIQCFYPLLFLSSAEKEPTRDFCQKFRLVASAVLLLNVCPD